MSIVHKSQMAIREGLVSIVTFVNNEVIGKCVVASDEKFSSATPQITPQFLHGFTTSQWPPLSGPMRRSLPEDFNFAIFSIIELLARPNCSASAS